MLAKLLRHLSRRLPVVVTLHQPSNDVLSQFDILLLLKPGGMLSFYGGFTDAARFFLSLPARFPSALGSLKLAEPQEGENLSDFVLGALKVISQRETPAHTRTVSNGDKPNGRDAQVFSCRDAFLHSSYSLPLLQALQHIHGESVRPVTQPLIEEQQQVAKVAPIVSTGPGGSLPAIPLPSKMLRSSTFSASTGEEGGLRTVIHELWLSYRELFKRHARTTWRSRRSFFLRYFTCTVYGFVTGTLFYQLSLGQQGAAARLSFLYFICRFSLFSANLKLPGVFSTRVLMFRETSAQMYSTWTYALSRTLVDLPWVLLEMFIFSTIVYFAAGLSLARDGLLYALLFCTLVLNRISSLGFIELVGAITPNIELAQSLQTAINMILMLFSGFFIPVSSVPRGWRWMNYVSPYYYAIRFLSHNEASQLSEFTCAADERVAIPSGYNTCPVTATMLASGEKCNLQCGTELLQVYSIPIEPQDGYLTQDICILLLFACAYPLLAAVALRYVNFVKR
jgi:ABC-type multidrug transport system permease subunit